MAGALSFVGGFFNGLNNANAMDAEKRMRDQERFGQVALQSITEYKREIGEVRKQHSELNAMGKQLIASGVESEKVDYALGLPYQQAVKLLSDPEALRNMQVKRQAPAQPAMPQAGVPAPEAAPQPTAGGPASMIAPPPQGAMAAPAAPAMAGGTGTVMPAQAGAMPVTGVPAPTGGMPQTFGIREGTQDPLAGQRAAIEELAKNAGWSPKMMEQFKQAMGTNQNLGVYRFANPETAGQIIFNDPKQIERVMRANDHAMNTTLTVAARLDPNLPVDQKVKLLGETFANAYKGIAGSGEGAAVMPSPDMFKNLIDPAFARSELERKQQAAKTKETVDAFTAEYIRQGMPQDQARIRAEATARGLTEREPRPTADPNPGFSQIQRHMTMRFGGELVPDIDPATGTQIMRLKITDPALRTEHMFATTVAESIYQTSLASAGSRGTSLTPAEAANAALNVLDASKAMLGNAQAKTGNNKEAMAKALYDDLKNEMASPQRNEGRVRALQGAITLGGLQPPKETGQPAEPPKSPAAATATPPPTGRSRVATTVDLPPAESQ